MIFTPLIPDPAYSTTDAAKASAHFRFRAHLGAHLAKVGHGQHEENTVEVMSLKN